MTTGVFIRGTGAYLPVATKMSSEIDNELNKPRGWCERVSGVVSRPVANSSETQEMMGAAAARDALQAAGLESDQLDLLLFAASVGRQPIPATAPLIKRELDCEHVPFAAFDVNSTCLSALSAMNIAKLHIEAGEARNVLIVSSEIASRALPWNDQPETAALFGDGAAAIVVSAEAPDNLPPIKIKSHLMETYTSGYNACSLAAGGTRFDFHTQPEEFRKNAFFKMEGHELYKLTRRMLPGFVDKLLNKVGWTLQEVDLVLPHQASPLALQHMVEFLRIPEERVFNNAADIGNLVSVSLPHVLHSAIQSGRIQPDMKILMVGTSAGVSIGGATLCS